MADELVNGGDVQCIADELREIVKSASPAMCTWRDISTDDGRNDRFFWVIPKTSAEAGIDMDTPSMFVPRLPGRRVEGRTWSSLEKAVAWMPIPDPPLSLGSIPSQTEKK
ncbi:MAG TPA: hypothetical protein VF491_17620 [Vicinamibacterales bacterium]